MRLILVICMNDPLPVIEDGICARQWLLEHLVVQKMREIQSSGTVVVLATGEMNTEQVISRCDEIIDAHIDLPSYFNYSEMDNICDEIATILMSQNATLGYREAKAIAFGMFNAADGEPEKLYAKLWKGLAWGLVRL